MRPLLAALLCLLPAAGARAQGKADPGAGGMGTLIMGAWRHA